MSVNDAFKEKYPDHYENMNDVNASMTKRILGEVAFNHFKAGWDAHITALRDRTRVIAESLG